VTKLLHGTVLTFVGKVNVVQEWIFKGILRPSAHAVVYFLIEQKKGKWFCY
jgi:hypothetical protein